MKITTQEQTINKQTNNMDKYIVHDENRHRKIGGKKEGDEGMKRDEEGWRDEGMKRDEG